MCNLIDRILDECSIPLAVASVVLMVMPDSAMAVTVGAVAVFMLLWELGNARR